jgi:hypothetical protein
MGPEKICSGQSGLLEVEIRILERLPKVIPNGGSNHDNQNKNNASF